MPVADHMSIASATRALRPSHASRTRQASRKQAQAVGLTIATLVPAAFWTALLAGAGELIEIEIAAATLALFGSSIALFLGAVCAPIMLRR